MSGARHRARVIALQALYENDMVGHYTEVAFSHCIGEGTSKDTASFAQQLVATVLLHRPEIDGGIQHFAPTYPVNQLSPVDRNILRLAISE
ncbi:MAG: transcription antitermination factor NusB, partial [Dehalococcoidia bacterium]|nr:transcription antitermination factor NusB [Dehalococcoidia bacterium]